MFFENHYINSILISISLLIVVFIAQKLFFHLFKRFFQKYLSRGDHPIAKFFNDEKFFYWITFIPTPLYIYFGIESIPDLSTKATLYIQRLLLVLLIFAFLRVLDQLLRITENIYQSTSKANSKPIKGYLQSINIVAFCVGVLYAMAIILDKSPIVLFSGLGAVTAILMLIFKDTLLSLVAGIQITTNELIRVGDWIEIPQFNADGEVVEIALHTVKVQNWDKTITVIPAHKFLENSFKNWRGMEESGGRRIKRSLYVDIQSIRFLNESDTEKFKKVKVLKGYMNSKEKEILEYNLSVDESERSILPNVRKLTNVGTFRNYISYYLQNHPQIHKDLTFIVRQLAPTPEGLPIEIYVFTNDTRWAVYEDVQSNIFDHLLAIMPEFGLRHYQKPTGHDLSHFQV